MNVEETEPATDANFDVGRYVAANPDVARYVQGGGDALQHFRDHGRSEGRRQLIAPPPLASGDDDVARYRRFSAILDAAAGGAGEFRFVDQAGSFPLFYGDAHYDLAAYDGESANAGFGPFVEEVRHNPDKLYADIGCGRRPSKQANCLYVEVYPSPSADIIMTPGSQYPIASGSLDGIGCFAVLEHVEQPWLVAAEFRRMLKPGGKVFIDWPFLQPVHGYPSHYYNATRDGLRRMFDDGYEIELLDTLANQTPGHTISWCLNEVLADLALRDPALREELLAAPVSALVLDGPESALWQRIVAALSPHTMMTLACGNTLIARKL